MSNTTDRGGFCPKCKQTFQRGARKHIKRCESFPSAEELYDMVKDGNKTISQISRELHTNSDWIRNILSGGGISKNDIVDLDSCTCDICGLYVSQRAAGHVDYCNKIPHEEIDRRMREDKLATISSLSAEYNVTALRIKMMLMHKYGWTIDDIYKKGREAKRSKHLLYHKKMASSGRTSRGWYTPKTNKKPRCTTCEIIVQNKGELCMYCKLEKRGYKSYRDIYG